MVDGQEEFVAFFADGRKRRLFAPSFEKAVEAFEEIGSVVSMDYADCLNDPCDPSFLPLQSGECLGIYEWPDMVYD